MRIIPGLSLALRAFVLAFAACTAAAQAQPYPNRPVKIIVAVQPGAAGDILARYLADALSRATGKNFFVENRPGAGGNIALAQGAGAPADGYTLQYSGFGQQIVNPFIYNTPGWEPKHFEPIAMVARTPLILAVGSGVPARNLQELIALSKASPKKLDLAVTSTSSRLFMELLNKSSGIGLFPITYNAPNQAAVDVMSGRVTAIVESVSALLPHLESGKMRAIAIGNLASSPLMPNLPSLAEQGVPQFGELVGWNALWVPAGTPPDVVNWLNTELNKILRLPETRKRFAEMGAETGSGTPQELSAYVAAERAKWGPIIREAGMKVN